MREILLRRVSWELRSNGKKNDRKVYAFALKAETMRDRPTHSDAVTGCVVLQYDWRGQSTTAPLAQVRRIMREAGTELPYDGATAQICHGVPSLLEALQCAVGGQALSQGATALDAAALQGRRLSLAALAASEDTHSHGTRAVDAANAARVVLCNGQTGPRQPRWAQACKCRCGLMRRSLVKDGVLSAEQMRRRCGRAGLTAVKRERKRARVDAQGSAVAA